MIVMLGSNIWFKKGLWLSFGMEEMEVYKKSELKAEHEGA